MKNTNTAIVNIEVHYIDPCHARIALRAHIGAPVSREVRVKYSTDLKKAIQLQLDTISEDITIMMGEFKFAEDKKKEIEEKFNGAPDEVITEGAIDKCASCGATDEFTAELITDDTPPWYECSCEKCNIDYTVHYGLIDIEVDGTDHVSIPE